VNADGTALDYSAYLIGISEKMSSIAVDSSQNAYVAGVTQETGKATAGAAQSTYGGGASNGFVSKLNSTGTALIYLTYLGGNVDDLVNSIAIDSSGNAYLPD
jgi:hypothetical protein